MVHLIESLKTLLLVIKVQTTIPTSPPSKCISPKTIQTKQKGLRDTNFLKHENCTLKGAKHYIISKGYKERWILTKHQDHSNHAEAHSTNFLNSVIIQTRIQKPSTKTNFNKSDGNAHSKSGHGKPSVQCPGINNTFRSYKKKWNAKRNPHIFLHYGNLLWVLHIRLNR